MVTPCRDRPARLLFTTKGAIELNESDDAADSVQDVAAPLASDGTPKAVEAPQDTATTLTIATEGNGALETAGLPKDIAAPLTSEEAAELEAAGGFQSFESPPLTRSQEARQAIREVEHELATMVILGSGGPNFCVETRQWELWINEALGGYWTAPPATSHERLARFADIAMRIGESNQRPTGQVVLYLPDSGREATGDQRLLGQAVLYLPDNGRDPASPTKPSDGPPGAAEAAGTSNGKATASKRGPKRKLDDKTLMEWVKYRKDYESASGVGGFVMNDWLRQKGIDKKEHRKMMDRTKPSEMERRKPSE